jgi:elongation factor P
MATTADLSRGAFMRFNGELVQVIEYEHRTPGNLRAFYQVKMRNVKSGRLVENRFRAGEAIDFVRVDIREFTFLYRDTNSIVVMDSTTFDQIYIDEALFGDQLQFMKEGITVKVSMEGDSPLAAEIQATIEVEVTYTEPGLAGDTATKTLKPATIETGAEIRVPLFVNIGDKIRVDTKLGEYMERVK